MSMPLDINNPLMQILGVVVAAALGCAAGLMIGTQLGRTDSGTPLGSTLRVSRERLTATCERLEQASHELTSANEGELAGKTLLLSQRVADLSTDLGRLQRKTKEASA